MDNFLDDGALVEELAPEKDLEVKINWRNLIFFMAVHSSILWQFMYLKRNPNEWSSFLILLKFSYAYNMFSLIGVTAGAHRLWSHHSYKAKAHLRLFLALCFSSAGQGDILGWCENHRVHHKFCETNADPHNASRGFFFSHIGWLLCKRHPDVIRGRQSIDSSDLLQDSIVVWQSKYCLQLMIVFVIIFPTLFPMYYWKISFVHCLIITCIRYTFTLNQTWLVNSVAHIHGSRPYDPERGAREQPLLKIPIFYGEMYHNYHHTFPRDYKLSEHGWLGQWNLGALFIDFMALIGLAHDLKEAPKVIVAQRKMRTIERNILDVDIN